MEPGTITIRTSRTLDELDEAFRTLYSIEDFQRILYVLAQARKRSDQPSILSRLYLMLDHCDIPYQRGQSVKYYTDLINGQKLPSRAELEDRMLLALYSKYTDYPAPEEYMKRIVDRLSAPEDGWAGDPLRLRILKQFIKYGNYLKDAGFGGRLVIQKYVKERLGRSPSPEHVLTCLDDGVFVCLPKGSKDQKKPEGKLGLLKLADDLAGGKFRAGGATRRGLYLFAMVYGMTYGSGDPGEEVDPRTDLEKNLFQDYYTNNLVRFITEAYSGNRNEYEIDPAGQGINYKNFSEMVYLYCIAQNWPPQEKIRRSSEMIEALQRGGGEQKTLPREQGTALFRERFQQVGAGLTGLSEKEFLQFLRENYNCDTARKVGTIQLETEQETAFACYQGILRELEELGQSPEDCNYGLWFTDVGALRSKMNDLDELPESEREDFARFTQLLIDMNDLLTKGKLMQVSDSAAMTRTSLLVAYYYLYNAIHEEDTVLDSKSFREVFEDFKYGADARLTAAYYQPLSGKNIFDVALVYSSYVYPIF